MKVHTWHKAKSNPVLAPGPEPFDVKRCMNPHLVREGDQYFLFYGGGDASGKVRICLATASVSDPTKWTKQGPVLDSGAPGAFDQNWCVLPCVHRFGDRWHLYWTGRNSDLPGGLQAFTGIGLAVSKDLGQWERTSDEPVLRGNIFPQWPDNRGIAGGGNILEFPEADGRIRYRMNFTLATGTTNPDLLINQQKYSATADSYDGVHWSDFRIVLGPRPESDYENAATIALNVWKTGAGYRAIYAGIGSRFGAYAICEVESVDGLVWERGNPGENLSLPPAGDGWESEMTEYPHIVREGDHLRLFYCGNGYGVTGIGTATAKMIDPPPQGGESTAK